MSKKSLYAGRLSLHILKILCWCTIIVIPFIIDLKGLVDNFQADQFSAVGKSVLSQDVNADLVVVLV